MIHRTINTTKLEPDIANTKISVFDDEDGDLPGFLVCTRPERKCWTYMQLGFAHSTKTAGVENPRGGREARNFTTNVPEILDLKWSSEQIFSKNWRWVPLLEACSVVGFVSVYTTSDFPVVIRRVGRCDHLVQLFVIKHYTVYLYHH